MLLESFQRHRAGVVMLCMATFSFLCTLVKRSENLFHGILKKDSRRRGLRRFAHLPHGERAGHSWTQRFQEAFLR